MIISNLVIPIRWLYFVLKKASLYEKDELKILIINQVIDWANEITNKIAPSIRAEMRDKNFEKSKKLRKNFSLKMISQSGFHI